MTPQHLRALEYANRIRLARAQLKREVKAGERTAVDVLRGRPSEAETMSVGELLRSQSRWARTRTQRFLAPLTINENRCLGRLTSAQRDELIAALVLYAKLGCRNYSSERAARSIRNERPWLQRVAA